MLDAVLVDPTLAASVVEGLRTWAGARVAVRMTDGDPDEDWLIELVRSNAEPVFLGPTRVDLRRGVVDRDGEVVRLTDTEALLLAWLVTRAGSVVSRGDLLVHVWGYSPTMQTRVVDVTMARLRTKIEADPAKPEILVTVRGKGYRLDGLELPEPAPAPARGPTPDLVGRDDAWGLVSTWFDRGGVATLLGPAGIGKTTLARAFSESISGSVWCSLQDAANDGEGTSAIARALNLPPDSDLDTVRQSLGHGSRSLVVLDNAEHLQGLVASLLERPACPVLVTSRIRLGLPAEHCIDLAPLSTEATTQLFLERARRLRADFEPDTATLEQLTGLCEGLPLAVELAAAQVRLLSGPDLVRALERGQVRARHRKGHRSYDEALDSSWGLLTEPERDVLSVLACVRGDVPLRLADELFDDPLEDLASLRDASLLQVHHESGGSVAHLLETVRRFVRKRSEPTEDRQLEVARGVLRYVEDLDREARGPDAWNAVRGLGRVRLAVAGAAETALRRGEDALAAALCLAMTHYYEVFGADRSDLALLERVGRNENAPRAVYVAQLHSLLLMMGGRPEESAIQANRCTALAATPAERAEAAYAQAMVGFRTNRLETTELEAALDDFDRPIGRARALIALGIAYRLRTEWGASIDAFRDALALADRMGVGWFRENAEGMLASAYSFAGEFERAATMAEKVARTYHAEGVERYVPVYRTVHAVSLRGLGRLVEAREAFQSVLEGYELQGHVWTAGDVRLHQSEIELDLGDPMAARDFAQGAARVARQFAQPRSIANAEMAEAMACVAEGRFDRARELAEPWTTFDADSIRGLVAEVGVLSALAEDDPERARSVLTSDTPAELGAVFAALIDRYEGRAARAPDVTFAEDHRNAWVLALGGSSREPTSPRGRFVRSVGAEEPGTYPETAVVNRLAES